MDDKNEEYKVREYNRRITMLDNEFHPYRRCHMVQFSQGRPAGFIEIVNNNELEVIEMITMFLDKVCHGDIKMMAYLLGEVAAYVDLAAQKKSGVPNA